jgi:hypothetical protein
METFKGTPGPWFVIDSTGKHSQKTGKYTGTFDIINREQFEVGMKAIADAKPYGGNFPELEEARANAKLIAASPDMLEAIQCALNLKDLWSAQQHGTVSVDHEGEMQALQKMQDKLEAALKKATA